MQLVAYLESLDLYNNNNIVLYFAKQNSTFCFYIIIFGIFIYILHLVTSSYSHVTSRFSLTDFFFVLIII